MIPKDKLVIGRAYKGEGRNFDIAIWDGEYFQGVRHKFGDYFVDAEDHYDEGSPHGTFKPFKEMV